MCCMTMKGSFDTSTKAMLNGFATALKQGERKNVFVSDKSDKLKKAIQFLDTGKNKERDVTFQTMEGKCIVQIEIYPGQNRPYYIRSMGKENGTYIRVAGTSRPVDEAILKDLQYQGAGKSYDEIVNVETDYDERFLYCGDSVLYFISIRC